MAPIDWRDLYAANQAAIRAARRASGPGAGKVKLPKGMRVPSAAKMKPPKGMRVPAAAKMKPPPGMRTPSAGKVKLPKGVRVPATAAPPRAEERPGGRGKWLRRAYDGPHGGRAYFLYTPEGLEDAAPAPLLVMLHGCTQGAGDVARGTRWNEVADRHGFRVVYPEQGREHNEQGCWNWFEGRHQRRGAGEPAVLAGLTREVVAGEHGPDVDPQRVWLAGMSAGGAMATVLAATYPEVFSAVGVHSGLPYRTATSQPAAWEAMGRGGGEPGRRGEEAFEAMGAAARVMPVVVVHGTGDHVVSPVNGDELVEQWLTANRLAGADVGEPSGVAHGDGEAGHAYTRYEWIDGEGRLVQEYLRVEGLGHAWSGGDRRGSYADPRGPDATQAMCDFFTRAGRG
jgi:poly(hydroxyalkanoate) depolymerase family esterase